jgi:hypothetical protein
VILNAHDKALLIALRKGDHFAANPGDVTELLTLSGDVGPSEGLSSARRLHSEGLAAFVHHGDGRTRMRITDTGIAFADNLIEDGRKKTWKERLAAVSRSDWISLAALIVSVIALFRPGN